MPVELNPIEARILGSLIEKSFTTPDQYPLSFNALLNACNQKTSRDPVMSLDTDALGKAIASLSESGLVAQRIGSRVPKYAHYAEHLGAGDTPEVIGTLGMLMLRGPQTAAEIRVRTERITQFPTTGAAEALLQKLAAHPDGPFVEKLSRGRYRHLFSGDAPAPTPAAAPAVAAGNGSPDRVSELENRVAALEERCKSLEEKLVQASNPNS